MLRTVPSPQTVVCRLGLVLLLSLGASVRAQAQSPAGPVTGATTTQQLTFAKGANMVSLQVYPADRSLSTLFGPELARVLLITNSQGVAYSPRYGIRNLTEWPWREALLVHALEPFTITVEGPSIGGGTPIPLRDGWNWVPAFVTVPTPIETALATIASSISSVEDVLGRTYPTAEGKTPLTEIAPGLGYRVHLSDPATLVYAPLPPAPAPAPTPPAPAPPSPDPPTPTTPPTTPVSVPTVLEAIALSDLKLGQEVSIRGFRAEGDGGAGVLRVTESGCAPDGGTCFIPTAHTQAGEPYTSDWGFTLFRPQIQWESFRLCHSTASAPQNPSTVTGDSCFEALQLHGHGAGAGGDKVFDPATGQVQISSSMKTFAKLYDGSDRFTTTFRYATDNVRLERVVDASMTLEGAATTAYTRPEWWGGQPGSDATDAVAWAWEAAEAKAKTAGQEQYVVLSGMYGYAGVLETQDGTVLKGAQDGVRDGQGLRVIKGAPWHYWAVKPTTAASLREAFTERDAVAQNMDPMVVLRHGRRSVSDRVVDIDIDGNLTENGYVFDGTYRYSTGLSSYSGGSYLDEMLQNTPHWNGFAASHQHNDNIVGSRTRLETVHIHDVGGNLWLSNEPVDFGGSHDVRLGNSARNHVIYGVGMRPESSIDRVEIYGFFWKGAHEVKQGTWRDLTFRGLVQPPTLYTRDKLEDFISHRNDDTDPSEFGMPHASGYYFGDSVVYERLTFDLNDAYPTHGAIYYARGSMDIRGVTVRQADPSRRLFLLNSRGLTSARSSFSLDGVTVESGGLGGVTVAGIPVSHVRQIRLATGTDSSAPNEFYIARPSTSGETFALYGVDGPQSSTEPVAVQAWTPGVGASVFVRDATFTSVRNHLMFVGEDPSLPDVQRRYHVYFRQVRFSAFEPTNNDEGINRENWRVSYFEAVTVGGRVSEDAGALTQAALPAGYVDVPVNLFYAPFDPSYVRVTGPDSERFTGWTNVGTARAPVLRLAFTGSAPVSVDWTAAVRPIPASVVFPD